MSGNMETCMDQEIRLIGYAGKDGLKDAFDQVGDNREAVLDFVKRFRDLRALNEERIRPVIPLLQLGGISSKDVCVEVRQSLIEIMKRQIQHLEQEQLDALLDKCYSFLTVPQLAPIGIAVLERLSFVDAGIWSQIVQNGLDESPYTDLPISIKKRIWVTEPSAFDYEVAQVINRIREQPPPDSIEHFLIRIDRQKVRAADPLLKELIRLSSNVDSDLFAGIIERFIQSATKETNSARRIAISNFFYDFVVYFSSGNHNFASLRKMAKYMDTFQVEAGVEPSEQIDAICEGIKNPSSRPMVALLVSSTYARDFLAQMLTLQLLQRRGPLGNLLDEAVIKSAMEHLHADPWISKLTFLCICNMKGGRILTEQTLPTDEEVNLPFKIFYPFLMHEMELDATKFQDGYYTSNGVLPNKKFMEMVMVGKGVERRVITTYCLQLFVHANSVGLARFRLVLDCAFRAMDTTEEVREAALAYSLIGKILVDLYPHRAS